jgi:histidyl-tRNA synthetase
VGFAAGVERLVIVLEKMRGIAERPPLDCYIAVQAEHAQKALIDLASRLRSAGSSVMYDLQGRSMKAQMREADRLKSRYVLIIGSDELARGEVTVKNMATGEQKVMPIADVRL